MNSTGRWALAVVGLFFAYLVVKSVPDIVRYIKISSM
jgi:hypothetical protein